MFIIYDTFIHLSAFAGTVSVSNCSMHDHGIFKTAYRNKRDITKVARLRVCIDHRNAVGFRAIGLNRHPDLANKHSKIMINFWFQLNAQ